MNLDHFSRYTEYDPLVPVWCLTPERGGCMHRFFDTSPLSPSGRYLAAFQMPFEDRFPEPGEKGKIVVVDLETGKDRVVAETAGWDTQMGANINWGGNDHQLFFNDCDTDTWTPFAWCLDVETGQKRRMEGTVYHASPDGKWLISANMKTMRRTQVGYGVWLPDDKVPHNAELADDDGFTITDTETGKARLLLSIKDIFEKAGPPLRFDNIEDYEVYGFHSKFNPQSDRLMLSLRWYKKQDDPLFYAFKAKGVGVEFAWVTCRPDGSELHCATGPELWKRGGHHATWFPDGKHISGNMNMHDDTIHIWEVNYDGSGFKKMLDVPGSGHPTVHPDGRHILTDTYTWEPLAYGDGTVPLRWIDRKTGEEQAAVRIDTSRPEGDSALRVDPHPTWDRSWRYVVFNGTGNNSRRVYIADMKNLIDG